MRNPSCLPACQAATTDYWSRAFAPSSTSTSWGYIITLAHLLGVRSVCK